MENKSESKIMNTTENKVENLDHKLEHIWVLYDQIHCSNKDYGDSLRKICEIDSIEKFWSVFGNYPKPSKLFNDGLYRSKLGSKEITSLSFFKKGIFPRWEDDMNKIGGEYQKRYTNKHGVLSEIDNNWFDIVIKCIGSTLDPSITGIRVIDNSGYKDEKKNNFILIYRIEVWFSNREKREEIGKKLSNILNTPVTSLIYKNHSPEKS